MTSRLLIDGDLRVYAIVFDTGDAVMSGLQAFAERHGITGASFTGIGAFQDVTLAYFDIVRRSYDEIPLNEQVELLGLTGNVATHDGAPKLHAHAVVGRRDGTTRGGHLLEAHVRPTLEVTLTETPRQLRRRVDQATGLPLIDLEA